MNLIGYSPFILGIVMQMEVNPDEDDAVAIEIVTHIQLILAVLCESDMHRKVKSTRATFCGSFVTYITFSTCHCHVSLGAVWIRGR